MTHALLHALGIDTQSSYPYDFWSGFGVFFWDFLKTLAIGALVYYHHNCHHRGCPKWGKHKFDGTPYCSRHKPGFATN